VAGFAEQIISVPFPRFVIGIESKEIRDRLCKSTSHPFKLFERRRVSSAFNQAQKVNGHANELSEVFLRLIRLVANLADSNSELFL
jgi:hypothetical protein